MSFNTIGALPIFVNASCFGDGDERLFPESKHRSKRILKKLIKRFGHEFVQVPCAFKLGGKVYMHPDIYSQLKDQLSKQELHQ